MKRPAVILAIMFFTSTAVFPQFSFYLVDNFEDGDYSSGPKWWGFGELKTKVVSNPPLETKDLIAESCGDYALNLCGESKQWYVGGVGTDLSVDASEFSRFQIDVNGDGEGKGRLKIELFDDDNMNYSLEQDPQKNYDPIHDDKWVAEVSIQGKGFIRTSIPFSAFRDANPGVGDDIWNPDQKDGSGGLLKMQLVAISETEQGKVDFSIDNLLLTY